MKSLFFMGIIIGAIIGFMVCWVMKFGDPTLSKEVISHTVDTTTTFSDDTASVTNEADIKPTVVYRSKIIRDDSAVDSMRAIIESLDSYTAAQTFDDSAWVEHTFLMTESIVKENQWKYRPPPHLEIHHIDTVEVGISGRKKLLYGLGAVLAGCVTTLVVENNR